VSSAADTCCQALAIDEHRAYFDAAVWTRPRHRKCRHVEQAWFPGSHANVGGGYADTGLSDLALEWMLKRLERHCPELKLCPSSEWPRKLAPNYRGRLYDSRAWLYWGSRWRPLVRLIDRCQLARARRCRLPAIRPHSEPIGEMVHWSALARWQETKDGRWRQRYIPRNLIAAIESVRRNETPVVGVDGEPTSLAALGGGNGAKPPAGADPPPPRAGSGNGLGEAAAPPQGA
jgi:hypothetical protein